MNSRRYLLLFLILGSLTLPVLGQGEVYEVVFQGLESPERAQASEEIEFHTFIANYDSEPHTDYKIKASIVDAAEGTVEHEKIIKNDVDLASREVQEISSSIEIPETVPSSNYYLVLEALAPTGSSFSSVRKEIRINNPNQQTSASLGSNGMYLRIPRIKPGSGYIKKFDQISAGAQGEHVIPGTKFDIEFKVQNDGSTAIQPTGRIKIENSYSGEKAKTLEFDVERLEPGESKLKTLQTSMTEPGTYKGKLSITNDNTELIESSVRIVIAGEAANVIRVENEEDTYSSGDKFRLESTYVGPADGTTEINNGYMELQVREDNKTVFTKTKKIDKFSYNPETLEFEKRLGTGLNDYQVRIELGKDDKIFDVWKSRYQKLEPEMIITDTGTIKEYGVCVDDGVCSPDEWGEGCYDCREYDERPESAKLEEPEEETDKSSKWYLDPVYLIIAAIAVIAILTLVWKRKGKNNQQRNIE
jgi:hypothetical protein